MTPQNSLISFHLLDEQKSALNLLESRGVEVETYGGKVYVEWDPQAAVTPLGQLSFFIDFLRTADLFFLGFKSVLCCGRVRMPLGR